MTTIFLHGLGQGPESWLPVSRGLEGQVPDLFALAGKEGARYPALYRAFAGYCGGFAGPLRLCGLSLGGILALQYAVEHPERVEALVLIGAQYVMPKGLLRFQNGVFRLLPGSAFRKMGLSKRDVIGLTDSMLDLDFRGELGTVSCPTLVLCGERDRANRKAAQGLQAGIPGAELAWIPGAGHEVNRDAPEALAEALRSFFQRAGKA